jgi:hypothetical protein
MSNFRFESYSAFFSALLIAAIVVSIVAFAIMLIWNALMPELVQAPVIDFCQAFMLMTLCRLLVGNLPIGGLLKRSEDE